MESLKFKVRCPQKKLEGWKVIRLKVSFAQKRLKLKKSAFGGISLFVGNDKNI